jgi:hypothetical protein
MGRYLEPAGGSLMEIGRKFDNFFSQREPLDKEISGGQGKEIKRRENKKYPQIVLAVLVTFDEVQLEADTFDVDFEF